ncbi:MAG: peptidoglycan-associated lipoprotein Pal [Rhodoferax sp.]
MMKRMMLLLCVTAALAGCGSSVKLDNVPVEDKSATAVSQDAGAGAGSAVDKRGVAAVDIEKSAQQGAVPAGPRIVYFDLDSFVIKPEFQSIIEAQARFIKADKGRKAVIEGHTDERGGREYNLALGQKRAEAVRSALALLGVGDAQLEAVSYGKEKPAAAGNDEAAMAKNRRAEIGYR